jgi:hypothetical protein
VTRLAAAVTVLGIAQIQFFFGYAESYTIMTAIVAAFIYSGFRAVSRKNRLWVAFGMYVLAGLFHSSAWCLLPGMMYLLWMRGSRDGRVSYKAIALLLAAAGIAALVFLYDYLKTNNAFVEIQQPENKLYSLFTGQHLADLGNILLLIAPLPIIILVGAAFLVRRHKRLRTRRSAFLFLCLAGGIAFTIIAEPNLGAVRDWDLLALFGVPAAFFAAYSGAIIARTGGGRKTFAAAGIAILLTHTAPWVLSNTSKTLTVERLKKVIATDVHYSPGHLEGVRLKSWGFLMESKYGDLEENERALLLRLKGYAGDADGWLNLARVSYKLGKYDQARSVLEVIEDYTPQHARSFKNMVLLYIELGEVEKAARKLSLGIEWFPDDPDVYFLGGAIGQLTKDYANAAMLYQKAVVLSPTDKNALMNYAEVLIELRDYDEAEDMLRRASALPDLTAADRGKIAAFRSRIGR